MGEKGEKDKSHCLFTRARLGESTMRPMGGTGQEQECEPSAERVASPHSRDCVLDDYIWCEMAGSHLHSPAFLSLTFYGQNQVILRCSNTECQHN